LKQGKYVNTLAEDLVLFLYRDNEAARRKINKQIQSPERIATRLRTSLLAGLFFSLAGVISFVRFLSIILSQ
jgi:hypothetical protein